MVGIGSACYLELPSNSKQRVLHPVRVVGFAEDVHTVESEDAGLPVDLSTDVLVYFEKNRELMQQSARIESIDAMEPQEGASDACSADGGGPKLLVSFTTTGEPASAESRQYFRVSTVVTGYQADVCAEKDCPVLDVSSTGLAVVSTKAYTVGNLVDVAIDEGGQTYAGQVCIKSIRDLGGGKTRYGMHCVSDPKAKGTLGKGLQQACMRLQREQLRRLAGRV